MIKYGRHENKMAITFTTLSVERLYMYLSENIYFGLYKGLPVILSISKSSWFLSACNRHYQSPKLASSKIVNCSSYSMCKNYSMATQS